MEQLEREYHLNLQQIDEEIDRLDAEMDRHAIKGVGGELGGGFLRFISWIAFILGAVALIICIVGFIGDGASATVHEFLPVFVGMLLFGILMFVLGGVWRSKGMRMLRRAYAKQEAAEAIVNQLKAEIAELREHRCQLEAHYQTEMQKQKNIFQQHMLNQQELIEQEVTAIQEVKFLSAATSDGTKECPQCAEVVKAKARICRFCNYQFDG